MRILLFSIWFFLNISYFEASASKCKARTFEADSFVCVCDEEFCDKIEDVTPPSPGTYKRIISSRDGHRFTILSETEDDFPTEGDITIKIDYSKAYQTMLGFGGAFSDSTGIVVSSLSKPAQEKLMRSYFSKDGIEYNLCRIPIGGTDFSTRPYSYDDDFEDDVGLEHFALTMEDFEYKIPLIKKALELSEREIRFFGCPWSPPAWMKENGKLNGKGGLLKEMWTPYSNYLIRFVEEYKKNNISLWGLSTINQPNAGSQNWPWNACHWREEDMRDWLKTNFGPALEKSGMRYLKIIISDHSRSDLLTYPVTILRDNAASKYVDGVGIHWYEDDDVRPEVMDELQNEFQDKFLLYTESCEVEGNTVVLGSWKRGENYASHIITSINHHSTGWVDWNMALDMQGGPTWVKNHVDSPIIVNEKANEFYKQPMFYTLGHFSKFVPPGSRRIRLETQDISDQVQAAAFNVPDKNSIVIVVLNKNEYGKKIVLRAPSKKYVNIKMDPKSIETIILNPLVRYDEL